MTDDIVKHLQDTAWCKHYNDGGNNPSGKLMEEAAAEILRLRTENEKLRAALKPIAELKVWDGYKDDNVVISTLTIGHIRAAAAALKETGDE